MKKLEDNRFFRICCNYIFPVILLLYPLRHIAVGLDLWDTGYNYANFRYMGTEHMDSMWLFSTYLANAAGRLLTFLPGGHTLLGLNLYTGIFVSLLGTGTYFFCKNRLRIPAGVVFLGEFAAISLCWCPTALLYNYLTYALFLACIFLLYEGLTKERKALLVLAGAALGTNVFVRFSNLPQAALILAVWGYGIVRRKKVGEAARETGLCFAGYAGAICVWLGYLSIRYGFSEYVSGIARLFAMTDTAEDYKASSMLINMVREYTDNLYWAIRICFFLVVGMVFCIVLPQKWKRIKQILCVAVSCAAAVWLYTREFSPLQFDDYISMLRPAILFLMLTLLVCAVRILQKGTPPEEKLLAMMIALQVLITSLGSNNRLYPSINNLFLAAPYVLWCSYRLFRKAYWQISLLRIDVTAVKTVLGMFLVLFLFQSIGFGTTFVFVESHGAKNTDTKVENNVILKGIRMSGERAEWMESISAYVTQNGLTGKEVILYGEIPSLSFYLDMPSAFNPWSDLDSYQASVMEKAFVELNEEIAAGKEAPVVILEEKYALFLADGAQGLTAAGYTEEEAAAVAGDPKFAMIRTFMEQYGYAETFSNTKFALYEGGKEGL